MRRKLIDVSLKVDMTTMLTSALDLARRLWRYGESDLAAQALALPPKDVLAIGKRIMSIATSGEAKLLWPDGPNERPVILASIEWLEGAARLPRLLSRLPESELPVELQATEKELAKAEHAVTRLHTGR